MKRNDLSMAQQNGEVQNKSAKKIKKKILIADDDPGIQDILTIIFERAGFEVEIKKNGEDLLNNKFTARSFPGRQTTFRLQWTGHMQVFKKPATYKKYSRRHD